MSDFTEFKKAVDEQFARMQKMGDLFVVNASKEELHSTYLSSFPEGTNPMYKTRTEYDCTCCKNFIRTLGDVVAYDKASGKLVSIWDTKVIEPFQTVANAMAALVRSKEICDFFLHYEQNIGSARTFQQMAEGKQLVWNHFATTLPKVVLRKNKDIASELGELRSKFDVMFRGLTEINIDAVDTVLELIAQKSIYRGEENKFPVETFRNMKVEFNKISDVLGQRIFCWTKVKETPESVSHFRNTSIGTLVEEISFGDDLEVAVKKFEAKVAPANYKRPTSLVTQKMIDEARKTVEELGLAPALERRYAAVTDVSVNDILFVDRNTKPKMKEGIFDELTPTATTTSQAKNFEKVEEIGIEDFLAKVVPTAETIEVMLENAHSNRMVSLIAPEHASAPQLFKWPNNFSWSYTGDMADSDIRQAVVARGGRVDGVFRFSHSWNYGKRNASLMDLHVFMPSNNTTPKNGVHDHYGSGRRVGWNNRNDPLSGGIQDVDYTTAAPAGYVPVENITFPDINKMPEGRYICKIHNWQLRQPTQGGFKAEIEFGGQLFQYEVDRSLGHKEWVVVAEVTLKDKQFTIKHHLPTSTSSKKIWGLDSQNFHKVSTIMLSPNHWGDKPIGNKHYFFMLDKCVNEDKARGFYNEFLKEELTPHRKVLELVGSKMKTKETENQLSGLGVSSTQRSTLLCRVKGKVSRVLKVTI